MDVKKLFSCLSDEEKLELGRLLKGDEEISIPVGLGDKGVLEWIETADITVRLYNCLRDYCDKFDSDSTLVKFKHVFKRQFLMIRNAGEKSWSEFVQLRGF